jgi:hypothetical protein
MINACGGQGQHGQDGQQHEKGPQGAGPRGLARPRPGRAADASELALRHDAALLARTTQALPMKQPEWMSAPIPDNLAAQRDVDGGTVTIVALTHTASAADVDPDTAVIRVFADRIEIPTSGVTLPGISSVMRARVFGRERAAADAQWPSSPHTISGPPQPLQPPISPPVNPNIGAPGNPGNPGRAGNKSGDLNWTGFETRGKYIINACGGQGQQGQDGQQGGKGGRGPEGSPGYKEWWSSNCIQGSNGGPGLTGAIGGTAGRAGDGGPGGHVTILCTGPTDPDNIVVHVTGGPPGDQAPQRAAAPGAGGAGGEGGPGAQILEGRTHSYNHVTTFSCDVTSNRLPSGSTGDTGPAGVTAGKAGPGPCGTVNKHVGGALSRVHVDDPHVFAQHQLGLREAIRRHAVGDGETARAMTTWLRMATPSRAHPSATAFAQHWPALHRRLAILARRIDRGAEPLLIPASAPETLHREAVQDVCARLLALGVRVEQAFLALSRDPAGRAPKDALAIDVIAHARTAADIYRTIALIHGALIEAAKDALGDTLMAFAVFDGADASDDIATTRALLEQRFTTPDLPPQAAALLDAIEEHAWFDACAAELASLSASFAKADPLPGTIPFRIFVFALYEDLRQHCLRYAAYRGHVIGEPLTVYPAEIATLARQQGVMAGPTFERRAPAPSGPA